MMMNAFNTLQQSHSVMKKLGKIRKEYTKLSLS